MELRHQLAELRGFVPLVIVCAVLAGALAYVVSGTLPRSYEARSTVVVGQSLSAVNPDVGQLLASQRLSATYAELATKRPILVAVIDELGLPETPEELAKQVKASAALDSTLLSITATRSDASTAAAIANALAEQLVEQSPSLQGQEADIRAFVASELEATQDQITQLQTEIVDLTAISNRSSAQDAQLNELSSRLTTVRSSYVALLDFANSDSSNRLTVVESAVPPTDPVWPRPLLNTLLATILGGLAVLIVVITLRWLDDSIKNPEEVREAVGLPTLGGIPRGQATRRRSPMYLLVMVLYPRSAAAEAYRTVRTNLDFTAVDEPLRTLLVTSPTPGDGKTLSASNLAVAYAQTGRRVLLLDADFRKPGIHGMFRADNSAGLSTMLLSDQVPWRSVVQATEVPNLSLLTTGPLPPNPAELIASKRMRAILDRLVAEHDLIVIDSPPLLVVADAALLATLADGVLLVFDVQRTGRDMARRSLEALRNGGARVLGVLLNRQPAADFSQYAAYYGGHGENASMKSVVEPTREAPNP